MVAVAKENMDLMMDVIQRFEHRKVLVVPGGSTRHRSICSGVLALGEEGSAAGKPKVVIVHDAVRPFVEEDFLCKIAMAAKEQGVSMIRIINIEKINHVLDLKLNPPPQSFPAFLCVDLNSLSYLGKSEFKDQTQPSAPLK